MRYYIINAFELYFASEISVSHINIQNNTVIKNAHLSKKILRTTKKSTHIHKYLKKLSIHQQKHNRLKPIEAITKSTYSKKNQHIIYAQIFFCQHFKLTKKHHRQCDPIRTRLLSIDQTPE